MANRRALLINPPVYDTQYWERWSLPHGLLKVATYLKGQGYETSLVDCLWADETGHVRIKRRELARVGTTKRWAPNPWPKRSAPDEKIIYCHGLDMEDLRRLLEKRYDTQLELFDGDPPKSPDEIWITSIMTYWWQSTRDVVAVCKELFPSARLRIGGIYPTLDPEHAKQNLGLRNPLVIEGTELNLKNRKQMSRDFILKGEIPAANDLELDLELYNDRPPKERPKYTILTTSRGCPRDCEYCAAYVLSGRKVISRDVNSVVEEIRSKYEMGIRDFCFYEDNLLMARKNFREILVRIIEAKDLKGIELHSPEGLEIRLVDLELAKLMREAGFRRVYLPLESIDYDSIAKWGRNFYALSDFEKAVTTFEAAGFVKPQQINTFVLFGLPGEDLQHVYDTAIYAANRTGSVIPMLFAPVPGTPMFQSFRAYIKEMGFDFHDLNGKLLPFLEFNRREMSGRYDLTYRDYYDVEAFMFRLNEKIRERTFKPGADSRVAAAFRRSFVNYRSITGHGVVPMQKAPGRATSVVKRFIKEYHGGTARRAR